MSIEQSLHLGIGGTASSDKTLSGWTGGGGIEIALGSNWSSKNEYLFVDLGNGDSLTSLGTALTVTPDYQFHMFRSALVYRFNGNRRRDSDHEAIETESPGHPRGFLLCEAL